MTNKDERDPVDRMVNAYEQMLESVDEFLEKAEKSTIPTLKHGLEVAREKAVEMNELTREEAEKVSGYIERDLKDAAQFLVQTGDEFRDWLKFDVQLIEGRLMEMFANVADRTRIELDRFALLARKATIYHTGEVTGPGTLVCAECGKELHFRKAGHIPPCPKCRGTRYNRQIEKEA